MKTIIAVGLLAAIAAPALAQSNVDPARKSSWSENCGWMNWRDAGAVPGQQGAVLNLSGGFLSGFVWGENIGWINLGNGGPYANTTGLNFGVNVDACNNFALRGLAWGENVGWINFSGGSLATPANPARFDAVELRLKGYAWGENIGWINLDVATDANNRFVGFTIVGAVCDCIDFNRDTLFPDSTDLDDFLAVLSGGPSACSTFPVPGCNDIDFNNDGLFPDSADLDAFLSRLAGGPCL
jgi:hypothetical protein